MKKLLVISALLLSAISVRAYADDSIISQIGTNITTKTEGHFLDNGTPGYFYDFKEHKLLAGGTTELLRYRWMTGNFGAIRSVEDHTNVFIITGLNFHLDHMWRTSSQ